jgi:hypothetical protein
LGKAFASPLDGVTGSYEVVGRKRVMESGLLGSQHFGPRAEAL